MLIQACKNLIDTFRSRFQAAGYDLRVGEQQGATVHVFITDMGTGIEDPKPVHIGMDLIRQCDTGTIIGLLAARCPFMSLLHLIR